MVFVIVPRHSCFPPQFSKSLQYNLHIPSHQGSQAQDPQQHSISLILSQCHSDPQCVSSLAVLTLSDLCLCTLARSDLVTGIVHSAQSSLDQVKVLAHSPSCLKSTCAVSAGGGRLQNWFGYYEVMWNLMRGNLVPLLYI